MKNIILLGGSNSVMVNGLQMGLKTGIEKWNAKIGKIEQNACGGGICLS